MEVSVLYGYAISYKYGGDGNLYIKVRIPQVHGPLSQREYQGKPVRNYVYDENLPEYPSVLLPHLPGYGEVVALLSTNWDGASFLVVGLMGGNYLGSRTNLNI